LFSISLGYKCDWRNEEGYIDSDVAAMKAVTASYIVAPGKLSAGVGFILALNARLLIKNLPVFDRFLEEIPHSTILAWTGSGEPSIAQKEVEKIRAYYAETGRTDRIEFDCNISE
jgi:hypothetical protein